jgi:hypothetical protein
MAEDITIVDCKTKQVIVRPETPEEEAARKAAAQ